MGQTHAPTSKEVATGKNEDLPDTFGISKNFDIETHGGGLFDRAVLSESKRAHIKIADKRIADITGQLFGEKYLNGLLDDINTIYDSKVPIRGILAASKVSHNFGIPMLKALQRAHYVDGKVISEIPTVVQIATSIGIDENEFKTALNQITDGLVDTHINHTHHLMNEFGLRGYPSFVAQVGDKFEVLQHQNYYGNPSGFRSALESIFGSQEDVAEGIQNTDKNIGKCDSDGCDF